MRSIWFSFFLPNARVCTSNVLLKLLWNIGRNSSGGWNISPINHKKKPDLTTLRKKIHIMQKIECKRIMLLGELILDKTKERSDIRCGFTRRRTRIKSISSEMCRKPPCQGYHFFLQHHFHQTPTPPHHRQKNSIKEHNKVIKKKKVLVLWNVPMALVLVIHPSNRAGRM